MLDIKIKNIPKIIFSALYLGLPFFIKIKELIVPIKNVKSETL